MADQPSPEAPQPDRESPHGAPEGSFCAEHPERPAAFTCPRCGNYVCIFCWHPIASRCEACLKRDPAAAAPPIPWEQAQGTAIGRFFRTLGQAFRPVLTAPGFAQPELGAARRFFLLTMVPCAMLAGVIPQTRTLMFGGSFAVTIQKNADAKAIALDIVTAMSITLGWYALDFLALALPYTSLVRAYAHETRRASALRVLLYRFWLSPAATLGLFLLLWALPAGSNPEVAPPFADVAIFFRFFLNALLFVAMRANARLAAGIGPVLSYVVVLVPIIVWALEQLFVGEALIALGWINQRM